MKKKLYICSIGVNFEDISIKTIKLIKKADIVINLTLDEIKLKKLEAKKYIMLNEYIKKYNYGTIEGYKKVEKVTNIMISKIEDCFKKYDSVVFLTNTNPLLLYYNNFKVYEYFSDKVSVEVYPAVSSIDYFTSEAIRRFKYYIKDFMILSFPYLIKSIDENSIKNLNLFIMYPLFINKENTDKILKIYDKNDCFYVIKCSFYGHNDFRFEKYSFESFKRVVKELDHYTTIFIPASDIVKKLDKRLKKLDN